MKAALARRETTDIVQVNLRMREHEHLRLKAAAQSHGVSLNAEMVLRLARTFEQPDFCPFHDECRASDGKYRAPDAVAPRGG